jgi:hypothetical protein
MVSGTILSNPKYSLNCSTYFYITPNNINGELWAIVSDEKTTLQTFAEYGLRFDLEENFLDDQSAGWNVQNSIID